MSLSCASNVEVSDQNFDLVLSQAKKVRPFDPKLAFDMLQVYRNNHHIILNDHQTIKLDQILLDSGFLSPDERSHHLESSRDACVNIIQSRSLPPGYTQHSIETIFNECHSELQSMGHNEYQVPDCMRTRESSYERDLRQHHEEKAKECEDQQIALDGYEDDEFNDDDCDYDRLIDPDDDGSGDYDSDGSDHSPPQTPELDE